MWNSREVAAGSDSGREYHAAVMTREVVEYLAVDRGTYLDMTVGGSTHSETILRALKSGSVVGIDLDPDALAYTRQRLSEYSNLRLVHGNFGELEQLLSDVPEAAQGLAGIVADLGLSRHEAVTPERGFSYQADGPLDMRFDADGRRPTALDLVRRGPEFEIARIIREFGEEPFWRRISRRIWQNRQALRTTGDLADLVRSVVPFRFQHKALARVFQALRIAVNDELENLRRGMDQAIRRLAPGARIAVISYHSLEDRIVKQTFRASATQGILEILTRKPRRPSEEEVARNPSARSARLRVAERRRAA